MKLNIVAVVLTVRIAKVPYSFVPIAEVTIMYFMDFNLRSPFKMTTFAVNVTGITYEIK